LMLVGLALLASLPTQGQSPRKEQTPNGNISSVILSGKVEGDIYSNTYLGISLAAPKAHWDWPDPGKVDLIGNRARLVNAGYHLGGPDDNYTLAVLADSQGTFPKGTTTELYVRSARYRVEGDNLKTYREEFPLTVSGVPFIGAVLLFFEKPNFGYYRGLYSTILNGYFVTIEVQCGSEERLQKLLSSAVRITPKRKP